MSNIKPWEIIQELESDNSRLFKEAVIEKNINDLTFQEGLSMCLDALITFGVKQVPKSDHDGAGLDWSVFKQSALLLINREKTGHAARDEILELMNKATLEEWNDWYRSCLLYTSPSPRDKRQSRMPSSA